MWYLLLYLLIINLVAFIMFYVDKRKAIKDKWRIRESSLYLVSFTGGVYGSILAMYLFHHKTRKVKFCIITALALIINIAIMVLIIKYVYF
ncbi:DUF1294 domain-containing protein [Sedimentibacter sp. zth1]|uniref:DUF1294 domain-containing protein n=1 Tax=Sedimentibacter sp. zth1 TaxID=2816908 RepID=UPI001A91E4FC|nr:DUF1294 domain-containing protein [Sedimentibacter sp. zth1]QSX05534.1 DUF1294 domain-containing protein [Sedimentibacter sp. zth1]